MRRGLAFALMAASVLAVGAAPSIVQAGSDRFLVDEADLEAGEPALVHAVVRGTPQGEAPVEIALTVEGPENVQQVRRSTEVDGGGQRLISMAWTPDRPGQHTLSGEALVAGRAVDLGSRTVQVASDPSGNGPHPLPQTAPGSIQWAIVFSILYAVTRSLHVDR